MTAIIDQTALIRGADGRLFAVTAQGVTEVAEQATALTAAARIGDRRAFNSDDHEAARHAITPGL
ncbi:hypothetical protein D9623_19585 [Azospirillum brasilense]|uniref:Uncharacterized protein n=1 Tax=Azospirillum brasilense TaxID=192 RepID=A0A0P0F9S4_AZOBR|nr:MULTISPECIES: hypothetical protein [Azospirillum]ALJ37695.1 hypothetical protein AMK58_19880 [Azospirillum brasilense]MDW7553911.1 hypothetical protein [Azospirillum brasilense]MDW7592650.1 hypothetical protein [Azospirillum brasilense]MDW7628181.1 hypothetical protein [Azospirillum brasilense]MDX5952119.1 hypothetical protein [Azospirillum brasilense]